MDTVIINEEKAVATIKAELEALSFSRELVAFFWKVASEVFAKPADELIGSPLDARAVTTEDGAFIERLDIRIDGVEIIDGVRWVTGGSHRLNLDEFNRINKRAFDEFLETKVDAPEDVTIEQFKTMNGL